jgi:predicted metallopeptidase
MGRKANPNKVEKVKNKREFIEDPDLITLANKVITSNKLDYLNQVKIRYVLVDSYISKTCIAKCVRASKELKYFAKIDYIIEISKDIWDNVTDEIKNLIMLHEHLHILLKTNKNGDLCTNLMQHDIQDFSTIIKKHGTDWIKGLKISTTSIRDMEVTKADNIKI